MMPSKEHREIYQELMASFVLGIAVVSDSKVNRIFNNIILAVIKTDFPIRTFNSENAAIEWIQEKGQLIEKIA